MDFEDLLGSNASLNAKELDELLAAVKASGRVGQITFVDDPQSPEGQAAIEYVNSHHWLPENYRTLPLSEVKALGKTLLNSTAKLLDKKKALMLLGHRGSIEAYRILKHYAQDSPPELKVWVEMAFEECKTFLATELSDEIQVGTNLIRSKIGRNQPCPCGSGKKYKFCCGKTSTRS